MLHRRGFDGPGDADPEDWEAPYLITNPTDDAGFREAALAGVRPGIEPDGLMRRLRSAYPAVTIHERLVSDESFRVWYVYREGRWLGRGGLRRASAVGR